MPSFDFRSLFTDQPQRHPSGGPGAESQWRIKPTSFAEDDQDPRFPAFQDAWKRGAGLQDLFGPDTFGLLGTVAPSGGENHRPDVAKVQTLLGEAGYVGIRDGGPNGYPSDMLDSAIRQFQQDKGLKVDGVLKPGGPTITALGGLLGGAQRPAQESQDTSASIVLGEWEGMDKDKPPPDWRSPPYFPEPKPKPAPQPEGSSGQNDVDLLLQILNGGKPVPRPTPPIFDEQRPRLKRDPDIKNTPPTVPQQNDPYPNHTISEDGAVEHDKYAQGLVRDSDPNETARYLKNVITWNGDVGRGDVADLLGRFAKIDGAKAKTLQDALHQASGERIPFRVAPLSQNTGGAMADLAEGANTPPTPATPFSPSDSADRWEAGNMAKALLGRSDYKDAITHFQGEVAKDRTGAMPYLAAVHEEMAGKDPELAGKFAMQMKAAGLAEPEKKPQRPPHFRCRFLQPPHRRRNCRSRNRSQTRSWRKSHLTRCRCLRRPRRSLLRNRRSRNPSPTRNQRRPPCRPHRLIPFRRQRQRQHLLQTRSRLQIPEVRATHRSALRSQTRCYAMISREAGILAQIGKEGGSIREWTWKHQQEPK